MFTHDDAPKVLKVPGRNLPARIRAAYNDGRDVYLLSPTSKPDALGRVFQGLDHGWQAAFGTSGDAGNGWTLTVFAHTANPEPFTYWPKEPERPVWRWACRACGTVDDRWSWSEADEAAPMVRQMFVMKTGEMIDVPWKCPRAGCHGAAMWTLGR